MGRACGGPKGTSCVPYRRFSRASKLRRNSHYREGGTTNDAPVSCVFIRERNHGLLFLKCIYGFTHTHPWAWMLTHTHDANLWAGGAQILMLARSSHGFLTQPNTTTALLGLSTRRCSRVWTLCRRPRCTWRGQPLESVSRDCYPWRGWSDTVPGPPGVTFFPRPRLTAAEQRPCAPPS